MKQSIISGIARLIFLLIMTFSFTTVSGKGQDVVGTWDYSAPNAPYEYSKGQLIISRVEDELKGIVNIDGYEIKLDSLKFEGNILSFTLFVEGDFVAVKLTIQDDSFEGKASTSQGLLDVTGVRIR